jgi:hypothetical protein
MLGCEQACPQAVSECGLVGGGGARREFAEPEAREAAASKLTGPTLDSRSRAPAAADGVLTYRA